VSRRVPTPLAAVLVALCQCASGPDLDRAVTLGATDRVVVVYAQPRREFQQTLLTNTVMDAAELYSSPNGDPLAKVLSQDGMQLLLDGLATVGFFDWARPGPLPDAASVIVVRINDDEKTWSKTSGMQIDEIRAYHDAMATFQNVYNQTASFHPSRGQNDVLEEHEKLRSRFEEYLERKKAKQ
jgi:hypothetical protein